MNKINKDINPVSNQCRTIRPVDRDLKMVINLGGHIRCRTRENICTWPANLAAITTTHCPISRPASCPRLKNIFFDALIDLFCLNNSNLLFFTLLKITQMYVIRGVGEEVRKFGMGIVLSRCKDRDE